MEPELRQAIQDYITYLAANSSSMRNAGARGVVHAAQTYLRQLSLADFAVHTEAQFRTLLDAHTIQLRDTFPDGAQNNWGAARKVLNIFLRDSVYHRLLCEHYRLHQLERWLEIPLDQHVASHLRKHAAQPLPWPGICRVTPELNAAYQHVATEVAGEHEPRIWRDYFWWRNPFRAEP